MRKGEPSNLVVYGMNCRWWDGIENIGHREGGLPCCPHCRGVLFQMDIDDWWKAVTKYEEAGHPGYRAFIEWLKGKCFRTWNEAKAAYEASGRKVTV